MTRPRILIVDDEPDVLALTSMLLQTWGYEVATADDAEGALELVRDGRWDVVLTDIGLSGLSGFDLARTVRLENNGSSPALIAVTGRDADLAPRGSEDLSLFDSYLVKPVEPQELRMTLASIIHG